jgi:hypothetical protein
MAIDPRIVGAIRNAGHPHKKDPAPPIAPGSEPKTYALIIAIVVIAVLLAAVLMVRTVWNPQPKAETITYNQFVFTHLADGFWQFDWQWSNNIYHVPLRYNPLQLGNVTVSGGLAGTFGNRTEFYLAIDPSTEYNQQYVGLAGAELSLNLAKAFGVKVVASCTVNETDSCQYRPVMNCDSENASVVVLHEGPGPSVTYAGDCITIQGNQFELVQAVDRLLYKFYGVMS